MRVIDAGATRAALPFERLIPALSAMFAAGCTVPPRHVHVIGSAGGEHFTSLLMPAWLEGRFFGVKTINIAPGNAARGLSGLHASYVLYHGITGVPLALIDGDEITARRTAAASALAASWLARSDARRLLVVGAGRIARLLPDAYRRVRSIDHVHVWARNRTRAERLVAELRQESGLVATVADDLQAAAGEADIVSCATLATEPLIRGSWLSPGCHLDLIGSFTPSMREADDACFAGAGVYVDSDEALRKSGDLLGALSSGALRAGAVLGTLETLARRTAPGRRSASQRTVFKSVGTALEDLAAAVLVFETTAPGDLAPA